MSKLHEIWTKLPDDVKQSIVASLKEGADSALVVLSARLATTDFAKTHQSFPKLLGKIVGHLRDKLHEQAS